LARRATFFNEIWEQGVTTLVLDAGDLFGNRTRNDRLQTEFLLKHTESFGYDAIGLGERDLNYGWDFLAEAMEKYRLPFTNANVTDAATGELILPEYLIVERQGITFGICAVMDPAQRIISMAARDREYEIADPVATLRELVPRLRERCDTVVLLSHLGDRTTESVIKEVQGIDLAVVGHSFRSFNRERIVGDTVMLSAVHEGRVVGRADVHVDPGDGKLMSVQVKITSLDDGVDDDPVMLQAVEDFLAEAEDRRLAQRAAYPRNLGSEDEQFLGSNNCKACHTGIYREWRQTDHARAYTGLRAKNMQFEPECLACHTTGYRYHNGFDEQQRTNLSHVQCEACHGYGTAHARNGDMNEMARESCVACHDEDVRPCYDETKDVRFDYATFWEKIAH
jgi:2',3'-cyclic-nucleotide 2'-phosphodiesterase (5'-nucleotidase family)